VKGSKRPNLYLLACLFHVFSRSLKPSASAEAAAAALMTQEDDEVADEEVHLNEDEGTREERAFRLWLNSMGFPVRNLFEDMKDGLLLLRVLDFVEPGVVKWEKVNMKPTNKFQMLENCVYGVQLCLVNPLKFSLVGIDGRNVHKGDKMPILAIVWQAMRYHMVHMLKGLNVTQGKEVTDGDILRWANEMVANNGKSSRIHSFKDPAIQGGHFLIDLLDAVMPGRVDYSKVLPGDTDQQCMRNAQYIITLARTGGCSLFLLWEDIFEVKPKMLLIFVGTLMQMYYKGKK